MDKTDILDFVPGIVGGEPRGLKVSIPRWYMTDFLQQHIDLLDRPVGSRHLSIVEKDLPHLRFSILEDDEWEQEKAKFLSIGLCPVDVVKFSGGSTPRFIIEHQGKRKEFEVSYTVFHERPTGTNRMYLGSALMSQLLTDTYVSPGVFTYAHVKLAKGAA